MTTHLDSEWMENKGCDGGISRPAEEGELGFPQFEFVTEEGGGGLRLKSYQPSNVTKWRQTP